MLLCSLTLADCKFDFGSIYFSTQGFPTLLGSATLDCEVQSLTPNFRGNRITASGNCHDGTSYKGKLWSFVISSGYLYSEREI